MSSVPVWHIAWSPGSYSKEWAAAAAYDKLRLICSGADDDDDGDVNSNDHVDDHDRNDHRRAFGHSIQKNGRRHMKNRPSARNAQLALGR